MSKFKSKAKKSFLPEAGEYPAKIVSVQETESTGKEYADKTPQIEVRYELDTPDGKRLMPHWYNLRGYKKDEDGSFIIGKDGKRKEDKENTQAAEDIFCGLAHDAGIEEGEDFEPKDLLNKEVGVVIRANERGNMRVVRSMPTSELAEEIGEELE